MTRQRPAAQLAVLLHHALFLSFFGAARRRGERSGAPLTTTLFAQSFAALVLVALLFPDTGPVRFAAATLSFSVALAATVVLGDWQGEQGSLADQAVVGTAPVARATRVLARLLHGLFFVTAVTLATAIPPGILAFWVGGSLVYAVAYFAAALLCAVLLSLLLVGLLQGAERLAGSRLALTIASWLRTLLLAGGFLGLALGLRAVRSGPEHFPGGMAILGAMPTYWAARLLEPCAGRSAAVAGPLVWFLALAAVTAAIHAALALWPAGPARVGRRVGHRLSWFVRSAPPGPARAHTGLCLALLQRERSFRLRALPLLLLPFAMGFLALGGEGGEGFFAVVQQFPAMYLPVLVPFLRGSEGYEARWIALTAPAADLQPARQGVARALLRRLFLPVFALLCALHALRFGPLGAIATTGFALGVLLLLLPRMLRALDVLPFSENPEELGGALELGGMLFLALLLTGAALLFQALREAVPALGLLAIPVLALGAWQLRKK